MSNRHPENTAQHQLRLARKIVDQMGHSELQEEAIMNRVNEYIADEERFEEDWEMYMKKED